MDQYHRYPDCSNAVVSRGLELLLSQGKVQQSYNYFSDAIAATTSEIDRRVLIHFRDAAASVQVRAELESGDNYARLGRYGSALESYSLITDAANSPIMIQFQVQHNTGVCYARLGRKEEALAVHLKALKLNPSSAKTLKNIAIVLADMKRYDEAIEAFDEYIRMNSKSYSALCGKAGCLKDLKLYKQSIEVAEKAQLLDPKQERGRCAADIKEHCRQAISKVIVTHDVDAPLSSSQLSKTTKSGVDFQFKNWLESARAASGNRNIHDDFNLPQHKRCEVPPSPGYLSCEAKATPVMRMEGKPPPFSVGIPGSNMLVNSTPYKKNVYPVRNSAMNQGGHTAELHAMSIDEQLRSVPKSQYSTSKPVRRSSLAIKEAACSSELSPSHRLREPAVPFVTSPLSVSVIAQGAGQNSFICREDGFRKGAQALPAHQHIKVRHLGQIISNDHHENSSMTSTPFSKSQSAFLRPVAPPAELAVSANTSTTSRLGAATVTVLPERDGREPKGVPAGQKGIPLPPPPPPLNIAPSNDLSSTVSGGYKSSNRKGLVRPTSQMCIATADTRMEAKRATNPVRVDANIETQDKRRDSDSKQMDQKGSYESREVCSDLASDVTNAESRSQEVTDSSVVSVAIPISGAVPSSSCRPRRRSTECMENPTANSINRKGGKTAEKAADTGAGVGVGVGVVAPRQGADRDRSEETVTRSSSVVPVIPSTVADSTEISCNETVVSVNSSQASVISTHKEENLSDAEFEKLLEMTREQWAVLPKWQQTRRKKLVGLF